MNRFARHSLFVACLALTAVPACRNRPGEVLPEDIQNAVDDVVTEMETASKALGGAVEGFASVDLDDDDTFGDCPEIDFVREGNVSTLGLTFEEGCQNDAFEDSAVSGNISIIFDRNAAAFDAEFDAFTVDGHTTDGHLHVSRIIDGDLRTWSGSIDLSTTGRGSVVGDIVLEINALTRTITIESAAVDLTGADDEFHSVQIEGAVIRPAANGNFVPQAGTVTFEVPNDDPDGPETITIIVEYDANSPVDGTVKVTFSDGTIDDYELPGF